MVTRRELFSLAGLGAALIAAPRLALATEEKSPAAAGSHMFWGEHQPGIVDDMQRHTYFVAFDVTTTDRNELIGMLKKWTQTASEVMSTPARFNPKADLKQPSPISGEAVGLGVSNLTVNFGFGPSFFKKDGIDRFGIDHQRPEALQDLPRFAGDQLVPERTGGDIFVQVCADDFMVVENAIRRFAKEANGVAEMRWGQPGFAGGFQKHTTPRNQMGFLDGTINVKPTDPKAMKKFVWVGKEGPKWLQGGTYMVIRPIRISLDHWDNMNIAFQEETVGRHKASGAPIGKKRENEDLGLQRVDKEGNPVVAEFSHAAMSAPEMNGGAEILRRAFNYDNGIAKFAERWPPWRQLTTFDAGLLFQCYQSDPRTGFIRIFAKMAQFDMLNQFTTHVGGGVFACPRGVKPGEYIGQDLFG